MSLSARSAFESARYFSSLVSEALKDVHLGHTPRKVLEGQLSVWKLLEEIFLVEFFFFEEADESCRRDSRSVRLLTAALRWIAWESRERSGRVLHGVGFKGGSLILKLREGALGEAVEMMQKTGDLSDAAILNSFRCNSRRSVLEPVHANYEDLYELGLENDGRRGTLKKIAREIALRGGHGEMGGSLVGFLSGSEMVLSDNCEKNDFIDYLWVKVFCLRERISAEKLSDDQAFSVIEKFVEEGISLFVPLSIFEHLVLLILAGFWEKAITLLEEQVSESDDHPCTYIGLPQRSRDEVSLTAMKNFGGQLGSFLEEIFGTVRGGKADGLVEIQIKELFHRHGIDVIKGDGASFLATHIDLLSDSNRRRVWSGCLLEVCGGGSQEMVTGRFAVELVERENDDFIAQILKEFIQGLPSLIDEECNLLAGLDAVINILFELSKRNGQTGALFCSVISDLFSLAIVRDKSEAFRMSDVMLESERAVYLTSMVPKLLEERDTSSFRYQTSPIPILSLLIFSEAVQNEVKRLRDLHDVMMRQVEGNDIHKEIVSCKRALVDAIITKTCTHRPSPHTKGSIDRKYFDEGRAELVNDLLHSAIIAHVIANDPDVGNGFLSTVRSCKWINDVLGDDRLNQLYEAIAIAQNECNTSTI